MELTAGNKPTYTREKKPRIKKGYYTGILKEVKQRLDKDGKEVEGKFGKEIIMVFTVMNDDKVTPISINDKPLELAYITTYMYKDQKIAGQYNSAITEGSKLTKVLTALGWTYTPSAKLSTDELLGNSVELNIDDYDAKWTEDNGTVTTYKASTIRSIGKIENAEGGDSPTHTSPFSIAHLSPEGQIKAMELQSFYAENNLTEEGLLLALKKLR